MLIVIKLIAFFCSLILLFRWLNRRNKRSENEAQVETLDSEVVSRKASEQQAPRGQHERDKQVEPKIAETYLTKQISEAQYEANEPKYRNYLGSPPDYYPPDWEWRSRKVKRQDRYTCQAGEKVGLLFPCSKTASEYVLHAHHIIPISQGGNHSFDNLITLCSSCHELLHPGMRNPQVRCLRDAITDAKEVWIDYYTASKNDRSERTVRPRYVYYRNGTAYLRAYCHSRKKEITFKVSEIINMRVLD